MNQVKKYFINNCYWNNNKENNKKLMNNGINKIN